MEERGFNLLFGRIKQLSNDKKFKIVMLTQNKAMDISTLSKFLKMAFNKCSNYCTQLEKDDLVEKRKEGKNTFVKSKVRLSKKAISFN